MVSFIAVSGLLSGVTILMLKVTDTIIQEGDVGAHWKQFLPLCIVLAYAADH